MNALSFSLPLVFLFCFIIRREAAGPYRVFLSNHPVWSGKSTDRPILWVTAGELTAQSGGYLSTRLWCPLSLGSEESSYSGSAAVPKTEAIQDTFSVPPHHPSLFACGL